MSSQTCPAGHPSDTNDFCSDCGIEMSPAPAAATPTVAATTTGAPPLPPKGTGQMCPKCNTERDDHSSVFCGVCGYNYSTGVGGELPDATPAQPVSPASPAVTPSTPVTPATGARVDVELKYTDPTRANDPALKFSLFEEENLLGRKKNNVKHSISIEDAAVSTRHAVIVRTANGCAVRDLNSTNGTKVNDKDIVAGAEQALSVGDVISVGEFTKITITAISLS